jgi:hypothetical protein
MLAGAIKSLGATEYTSGYFDQMVQDSNLTDRSTILWDFRQSCLERHLQHWATKSTMLMHTKQTTANASSDEVCLRKAMN